MSNMKTYPDTMEFEELFSLEGSDACEYLVNWFDGDLSYILAMKERKE